MLKQWRSTKIGLKKAEVKKPAQKAALPEKKRRRGAGPSAIS